MARIQFKIRNHYANYGRYLLFYLESPVEFEGKTISFVRIESGEFTEENVKMIINTFGVGTTIEIVNIDLAHTNINRSDQAGNLILYEGANGEINRVSVEDSEQANQNQVLSWINNNFSLQTNNAGDFISSETGDVIHPNEINNQDEIFQAIENYIRNHPNQFRLGKFTHENANQGITRAWWSPIINDDWGMIGTVVFYNEDPDGAFEFNGVKKSPAGYVVGTRIIENTNNERNFIHPGSLTKTQYEKLKKLIPNTCHVEGCCNNHPDDPLAQGENSPVTIIDNKCRYHREVRNSRPNNHNNDIETNSDDIFGIISRAQSVSQSNDLEQIKQVISELENIKTNRSEEFNLYEGETQLNLLKVKKTNLEANQGSGETNQENNNQEENEALIPNPPPTNNDSSSLQIVKNKAIQEITAALVNQEPKLTTEHDLSEINWDWKKKINAADNENDIINIKEQVMADIVAKRKAKKETENITKNLETEGKDAEQLKEQLQEVEKSKGQQGYEDNQSGIYNLKNELAKKVSKEEYSQIIVDTIKKNMAKYDIKEDELSPELKKDWEKLKSGEFKDKEQVDEVEKKLAKDTGQKGSEKKLRKILQEAQEALKSRNKNKIKAIKSKLYNFLVSDNIYEKSLLVSKGKEVKQMLKNLENNSFQKQTSSDKFPWKVVIPVALILVIFVLGIIIYRKKKKKLK